MSHYNPVDIKIINTAKKHPNAIINGFTEIKDKKPFFSAHP